MTQSTKELDRNADVVLNYKPKEKKEKIKKTNNPSGKVKKTLNERITEGIVRDLFRSLGYYQRPDISVEEQSSASPKIDKLLKKCF